MKHLNTVLNFTPDSINDSVAEPEQLHQNQPHNPQPTPPHPHAYQNEESSPHPQQHSPPIGSSTQNRGNVISKLKREKKVLKQNMLIMKMQLAQQKRKCEKMRKSQKRLYQLKTVNERSKPRGGKKLAASKKIEVSKFLCRDNNSQILPGKKDTKTKGKNKKQRRVLLRNLKELHSMYNEEVGKELKMSYRQFVHLRPFFVTAKNKRSQHLRLS